MNPPYKAMSSPLAVAVAQFVYHLLWYLNVRSTAVGHVRFALITDVLSTALYISIIKRLVEDGRSSQWIGLMVGGSLGSWVGLHLPLL